MIATACFMLMIIFFMHLLNNCCVVRSAERPHLSKSRFEHSLPSETFERVSSRWNELGHLIIVPGHAIQWCTETGKCLLDESCWYLQDFQRGQVPVYLEHIKSGVKLAKEYPNSLLIFSGGHTRRGTGDRSEGRTYFSAAERMKLVDGPLYDRIVVEEFARDSLENLVFSLARFHQITGHLPNKVTVVGFPFKEQRFRDLHRQAAGIPSQNFEYVPVHVEGYTQKENFDDAYNDFLVDPFGCGPKLMTKKNHRNPYHQQHGYADSCPELENILLACNKKPKTLTKSINS